MGFQSSKIISDLVNEINRPVSAGVKTYFIGDGVSWGEQFAREFDASRKRSAVMELRTLMLERIASYERRADMGEERRALLARLSAALRQSDLALIRTASLVGLTRRSGLFEKIQEIVAQATE